MKELIASILLFGIPIIIYVLICWAVPITDKCCGFWSADKRIRKTMLKNMFSMSVICHAWVFAVALIIAAFTWGFYVKMGVL
jgi:hypothetical protein